MSAAMLDSFDSPMLDYHNDHDIPMQNNSDPWYHGEEHIMEDAGHDDGSHGSIEVDMEGFEEDGNPEYEMVDTEEVYGNQTHESIEMEMYEASHNPSPYHRSLAITEDDTQAPNTATVDFNETSKLSTPLLLSPKPVLEEHTMAASPLPFSDDVEQTFIPAAQPDLPLPIAIPVTADFNETVDQRGTSLPSVEDDQQLRLPVPEVDDAAAASNLPPVVVDEVPEGAIHPVRVTSSNEDNLGEHTEDDSPSQAESHAHQDDKDDEVPPISIGAGNEDAIILSQKTHLDGEHYQEQEQEDGEEDVHHEHTSSAASSGDPHEISEGVYIDPPPPVLMSFSAEVPSVTLFNLASDSSGALAPSEPTLLLVHQPTLYYEPLSSVFEALRQEEYIQSVPGLLDGELVLNAFDLELILSEDHTFSQEVTLHDLNVLHDGLRRAGPLRVQLKRVGPRFLDRYHALQQEVERLELFNGQPPNHVQASNEDQAEHGQDTAHISSTNQPQTEHGHSQAEAASDHDQHEHDNDVAKLEAYEEAVPPPPEDDDEDGEQAEEQAEEQAAEHEQTDIPPQSPPLPQTSVEEENKTEDIEQNTYGVEVPTDLPEEQNTAHAAPPTTLNNEPREQSQPDDDPPRAETIPNLSESVRPPSNRPKDREDLSRSDHTDELFEEFEEFHEDDESGTLSDPGVSEHASVDHTAASFHEDYNDQDWEASFAGNDNSAEAKHHQEEFLLEEPIKLQRVQSFGSSKRSISEAELEDFDDGDTTLTGSPGSKRPRKE